MAIGDFVCELCGAKWTNPPGTRGPRPRFCSEKCARKANYAPSAATPEARRAASSKAAKARWDGTTPEDRAEAARIAAAARWVGHTAAPPRRTKQPRECRFCGACVPMSATQKTCGSQECKQALFNERMREYLKGYHERKGRDRTKERELVRARGYTEEKRARDARRRALKVGATVESFTNGEIFDRDGWVCGICNEPVPKDAAYPDPLSVSLDHIIPLSLGGAHSRENTRCSHLGCNVKRGNRVAA